MKIIHVRDVANVGTTLVAGLRRLGHDAELRDLTNRGGGLPLPLKLALFPERLREGLAVNRYARGGSFDVVHLHVAYMGWLGLIGRYNYFLHGHGLDLELNLKRPIVRWFTVRSMLRAERFYYSTPDLAQYATTVRSDSVFLPNPIDVERFRPNPRSESKFPRLLLLGRFEAKKGPQEAMRIIRALRRREPSVEVDAFNWGPQVRQLADPNLVRLIPTVPYAQMPELIGRYDILLGQFRLGILSMMELEAMACGKPLVTYFKYPEVYDEPPPVFSTADPDDGAAIVSSLLGDATQRREAGERGRAWVESNHHFVAVARKLESDYLLRADSSAGRPCGY
jgi:glycosyltransferase involved in cell wall biosynthesis